MAGRMNLYNESHIKAILGPDKGKFVEIRINSIQRQRSSTRTIQAGQAATCAITFPNSDGTESPLPVSGFKNRKGQVILPFRPTEAYWELEAEIHVLYHSTKLAAGLQGVVYCGNVRQGARVIYVEETSHVPSPLHTTVPDMFNSVSSTGSTPDTSTETGISPFRYGLRTGQRGIARIRFVYEPEWLVIGRTLLFRGEGRAKCVGKVLALFTYQPNESQC